MEQVAKRPAISHELVAFLESAFPDKCPDIRETNREIWLRAGQVSLVKRLRAWHEEQMQKEMESQ